MYIQIFVYFTTKCEYVIICSVVKIKGRKGEVTFSENGDVRNDILSRSSILTDLQKNYNNK